MVPIVTGKSREGTTGDCIFLGHPGKERVPMI